MRKVPTPALVLCAIGVGYVIFKLVLLWRVDAHEALLLVLALAALVGVFLIWGRRLMEWLKG